MRPSTAATRSLKWLDLAVDGLEHRAWRRLGRAETVDRLLQQMLLLEGLTQAEIDGVDPPLELGQPRTERHVGPPPARLAELSDQLVDGLAKQPEVAVACGFGLDVVEALIEAFDLGVKPSDAGRRRGSPLGGLGLPGDGIELALQGTDLALGDRHGNLLGAAGKIVAFDIAQAGGDIEQPRLRARPAPARPSARRRRRAGSAR